MIIFIFCCFASTLCFCTRDKFLVYLTTPGKNEWNISLRGEKRYDEGWKTSGKLEENMRLKTLPVFLLVNRRKWLTLFSQHPFCETAHDTFFKWTHFQKKLVNSWWLSHCRGFGFPLLFPLLTYQYNMQLKRCWTTAMYPSHWLSSTYSTVIVYGTDPILIKVSDYRFLSWIEIRAIQKRPAFWLNLLTSLGG